MLHALVPQVLRRVTGVALVAGACLAMAPVPGHAQVVLVRVMESTTNRPIEGALVSLLDETGRITLRGLSNTSGRLTFKAPAAGRYRITADRIGHPGAATEVFAVDDTTTVLVTMPAERVMLPDLLVRGANDCEVHADGTGTAALWEEIRKALAAGQVTAADQRVQLAVRRYRRYRTPSGVLRADTTVREYLTRDAPFVSPPPSTLLAEGFIRPNADGYLFHAPDAATLLSVEFLANHCLGLARPTAARPEAIGLSFRPTRRRDRPGVRGVLWVDQRSFELRTLEFEYVNAPAEVAAPGIGGRVEFVRLSDGHWIIGDWYIRAAERIGIVRRGARRTDLTARDSLVGYLEEGGTVRPATDVTLAAGEPTARVRDGTRATGDLRGRLVAPDGTPIAGGLVTIAEIDSSLSTSAEGRFEMQNLPVGRLTLRIQAIGFRSTGAVVALGTDRRMVDTTFVLQRAAQLLDSVVVAGKADSFVAGKMLDVERRRAAGLGKFLTRDELHDPLAGGLDMQLRRFARVRVAPRCAGRGHAAAALFNETPPIAVRCDGYTLRECFMAVYIDGAQYWSWEMGGVNEPPDLDTISPLGLEAVEVYRGYAEVPIEYSGRTALCGVVLLWTRVQ